MQRTFHTFIALLAGACFGSAQAQGEPNVLGLPAVPQTGVHAPQPAASGARGRAGGKAPVVAPGAQTNDSNVKSALNGGVTMASSYLDSLANVRVVSNTAYKDEAQRSQVLAAARLVQRDLYMACGKQCKPGKMTAPLLLPDGKLQFDMVIDGLGRALSNEDMIALLLAKPLAVAKPPAVAKTKTAPTTSAAK